MVLDCGHAATPDGLASGKATDPRTGHTMCYPCANQHEAGAMSQAERYTAYLSGDGKRITTWTGGTLATVVSYGISSPLCTPSGGEYRREYVRAKTPDGTLWYGTKSDQVGAINLRRLKQR